MPEEGPKIEIAGAREDIGSIKKRAEATKVNPYEPTRKKEEPKKEPEGLSETTKVVVGTVVGAGIATAVDKIDKGIRDRLSRKIEEENAVHSASFAKVMSLSHDPSLSQEEKDKWNKEKNLRIEEFEKLDEGNFVADTRRYFQTLMRTSEWDSKPGEEGVYDQLNRYSESREGQYRGGHESDPRLRGLIGIAIRAEAAKVLVAGVENKLSGMERQNKDIWLKAKHYSDAEIARLKKLATENHIFDFATDAPEELVGTEKNVQKEPVYERLKAEGQKEDEVAERLTEMLSGRERAQIPPPKYIGALFKGGLYEHYFVHETIPVLDIKNPKERDTFIFENIHIFDYLLEQPGAWQAALGEWLSDAYFAARANGLKAKDMEDFEEKLKAMMAVTASARCIEKSNGALETYGLWLTTGGQGKEADLDIQDQLKDKILHNDPEKLNIVLSADLVWQYYDQLLKDMGISVDRDSETGERNRDIKLTKAIDEIRMSRKVKNSEGKEKDKYLNKVVEYCRNGAAKGGLTGYIKDILLRGVDQNSSEWDTKWAAARLACDVVMADGIFTLWEYSITNGRDGEKAKGGEVLKLYPVKNYGGDCLRSFLQPSYLPDVIKKSYPSELGQEIMRDLDRAFRPEDIFRTETRDTEEIKKAKAAQKEPTREVYEIKTTMTEHWKNVARWGRAHWMILGGSQAEKLHVWSNETGGELRTVALLLNHFYGVLTEKYVDKKTKEEKVFPLGKHMVGAMMARIIKVKAKAYATHMERLQGLEAFSRTIGDIKEHPNYQILSMLWGPKVDATSGLRADLAGGELQLVFKDNEFGAYEDLLEAKAILETGNPRIKGGIVGRAAVRTIGDIFRAFGKR
mgnify:CR=1 FL=1